MALELMDHCHLGTSNPPVTSEYTGLFDTQHYRRPTITASVNKALSGKRQIYVLADGDGAPVSYYDVEITLLVSSHAALETLLAFLGQTLYFVPPYHDDASLATYVKQVKMLNLSIEVTDAVEQYFMVKVMLLDMEATAL